MYPLVGMCLLRHEYNTVTLRNTVHSFLLISAKNVIIKIPLRCFFFFFREKKISINIRMFIIIMFHN